MTETTFEFLIKSAMGISRSRHEEGGGSISKRSCSVSKSFKPIVRKEQYTHHFLQLSEKLAIKIKSMNCVCRTVSINLTS
jgi:hypothetical protein